MALYSLNNIRDHAGGNIEILSTYKNLKVYGGEEDDVAGGTGRMIEYCLIIMTMCSIDCDS